jgi:hypothetical protein
LYDKRRKYFFQIAKAIDTYMFLGDQAGTPDALMPEQQRAPQAIKLLTPEMSEISTLLYNSAWICQVKNNSKDNSPFFMKVKMYAFVICNLGFNDK